MAAVTADTLVLPRVKPAGLGDTERPVLAVSTGPTGYEGEGFPVRRTMAGVNYTYLDPFIMMDHMGEVEYAAGEPKGTNWHPHRGFETVTYLIDGQFIHQDTHGGGGVIHEGATQWMTAGSGLLHIETPPEQLVEQGGLFNGFQLWVNLPAAEKFTTPAYQPVEASDLLLLASEDGGALLRVIAGEIEGPDGAVHTGPGFDPLADHAAARLDQRRCPAVPAVAGRLQRAGLRLRRQRHGRRREGADPRRPAGRLRRRRPRDARRGREAGQPHQFARGDPARRASRSASRWCSTARSS